MRVPRRGAAQLIAAVLLALLTSCGDGDGDLPERSNDPEGDEVVPGDGGPVD